MSRNSLTRVAVVAIIFLMACIPMMHAADYYVAPNGSPRGDGSRERPWDLATALNGRVVGPGSTVWIEGGTYRGAFTSYLHGTSAAPITVRVAPGARAILDGHGSRGERQNSVFAAFGEWTNYLGLELTSSETDRSNAGNSFRQSGFDIFGQHVKLINFIVHDTGEGNGMWSEALDSELYGTIIFHCGSKNTPTDNRHGHALYTQNHEGTKLVRDNLMFNNYGFGVHGWGKPKGIQGYQFEGNVIFNSGAPSGNGMRLANILLTGGSAIIGDRITLVNNYTFQSLNYQPSRDILHDSNVCLVCDNTSLHGTASIRDNYFAGGAPVLLSGKWQNVTVTGNTLVGSNGMVVTKAIANPTAWDRNSYYGRGYGGQPEAIFSYNGKPYNFSGWQQQTHADGKSTYNSAMPKNAVFVRPNQYEKGRAHIAVYNWEHAPSVEVDLSSVLSAGSQFEIRNAQDFFGAPVVSGTYRGGTVRLPMTGLSVRPPLGDGAPPATLPDFNAFVVLPAGKITAEPLPAPVQPQQPAPQQSTTQAPPTDLGRFVGTYYSVLPPGRIDVINDGGNGLRVVMSTERGRPSYPLNPLSELRFRPEGSPAGSYLEFEVSGTRVVGAKLVDGRGPVYNLKKK